MMQGISPIIGHRLGFSCNVLKIGRDLVFQTQYRLYPLFFVFTIFNLAIDKDQKANIQLYILLYNINRLKNEEDVSKVRALPRVDKTHLACI